MSEQETAPVRCDKCFSLATRVLRTRVDRYGTHTGYQCIMCKHVFGRKKPKMQALKS